LIAADAAVDRSELDRGGLPRNQPRCLKGRSGGPQNERASIHNDPPLTAREE
jgi:hypothetical protein